MDLEGKVAIITGSSRGIGKAIAKIYAREGANVVVTARTEAEGQSRVSGTIHQTVEEINAQGAGKAIAVRCDITKEDEVEAMYNKTREEFGRIDIVFNNAGGAIGAFTVLDMPVRRWDQNIELNVRGLFLTNKLVLPIMIEQGGGQIINMSSGAAESYTKNRVHYSTVKAAVERFTRSLAEEVREYNISVNAYRPGTIRTEGIDYIYPPGTDLSRYSDPEVLYPSVVWLAKQAPGSLTGQVVSRLDFGEAWGKD